MMSSLLALPDDVLLRELRELAARNRTVEVDLLVHLGEVEARSLHLEQGFPSMFAYCTDVLRFSEGMAYYRIRAARAARLYPEILDRLRAGEIHLAGVKLLAPHLTPANHIELLDLARHKSERAIEELLADRAPKPKAPATVRKLPTRLEQSQPRIRRPSSPPVQSLSPEPLGQDRFKVQFTADGALRAKLREAQALLRHQVPAGDLAEIVDRALTMLIQDAKRKKFAKTSRPTDREQKGSTPSRHIPARIKRAVAARDEERCAYISPAGRRCGSPDKLEFHHKRPWARSKCHAVDGIELRCRAHNHYAAIQDFGPADPYTGPGTP